METRTVEYFIQKIEQIDAKIEKCFKAFQEGSEHIHHYRLDDGKMKAETTYVSVSGIVNNIQSLEKLRAFYIENINEMENRAIRQK